MARTKTSKKYGSIAAEAMWLGKPVIATGYSGNLDFMTAGEKGNRSEIGRNAQDRRALPVNPGHQSRVVGDFD